MCQMSESDSGCSADANSDTDYAISPNNGNLKKLGVQSLKDKEVVVLDLTSYPTKRLSSSAFILKLFKKCILG